MPLPSPFHPRTSALCRSLRWKDWAGYLAVCSYQECHEREYYAFRNAVGLMDVTPLFKYEVNGPDAAAFLSRVMVKNIEKLGVGRVTYLCWCDDDGKVLDDGTVARLSENSFRVTAAEPSLAWFHRNARAFDVTIEDSTDRIAAVSLQGPNARAVLEHATEAAIDGLGFFQLTRTRVDGFDATITRTGYTGDLGYEVWVDNEHAIRLWDVLTEAGRPYGLEAAGLDALDVTRVEAGFIMNGVDYFSANHCLIDSRKSTPYEIGLGWTVNLDRDRFNGQAALQAEHARGPAWKFVGLEIDWDEYEARFARHGLPPEVCSNAWRDAVPLYTPRGRQVGQATSGAWSPILKKNLALASVRAAHAAVGTELKIEITVEYVRERITATIRKKPFFDPPRKKATPPA